MADGRLATIRQLIVQAEGILRDMVPTRHWDEPLPDGPLLDLAQAHIALTDAIIKIDRYEQRLTQMLRERE